MVRFEQRGKLAELPDDWVGDRDVLVCALVDSPGFVLEEHISVKAAAEFSGYNIQYLRRLLRAGRLEGMKIGQVRLNSMLSREVYLKRRWAHCDDG